MSHQAATNVSAGGVLTGLDRLASGEDELVKLVAGRRVGLVAHPASVDRRLVHAKRVLEDAGAQLISLFGPEHGYGGEAQDMIAVEQEGAQTGPRVYSLYGETFDDLRPTDAQLAGVDVMVVDLQDVGARYYTFIWTAALVLEEAARRGIETVILDRPNPIGGDIVEGRPQREGFRSFVGLYDISVRHGMTIGETTTMVQGVLGLDEAALTVVEMKGWSRSMWFDQTGLPWVYPSPNMPTLDTATVYPGGCLIEGTLMSEGRGSTRPFEVFGAPWVDGDALAAALNGRVELAGARLRPLRFQPTFQKLAGQLCGGVQLHVDDREVFRSYAAYQRIIAEVVRRAPDAPRWRTDEYEYVTDRPAIDLLTGGPELRQAIDAGQDIGGVLAADRAGADAFARAREAWLRY